MPILVLGLVTIIVVAVVAALVLAIAAARRMSRPRPALPINCGDCVHMLPRAKVYKRETLEDPADGLVHYLCEQRWIEVTPNSPWCELGKSKTRTTMWGVNGPPSAQTEAPQRGGRALGPERGVLHSPQGDPPSEGRN